MALSLCACSSGGAERSEPVIIGDAPGSSPGAVPEDVTCADPFDGSELPTLAEAYEGAFAFGAAVTPRTFADSTQAELVRTQFNQISPENLLKWSEVQPAQGSFRFSDSDAFVEFAEENGHQVYGHVLLWHQQTPSWVFEDDSGGQVSAEELWARLEAHIAALAERYGSRIHVWDVVNEAFMDDGSLRSSPWREILGDDYIAETFVLADRLLPGSKLVYNDYSMFLPAKRDAAAASILDMRARGIRVDAVGMQGHYNLRRPTVSELDDALAKFEEEGIEVYITELDVDALPSERDVQGADLDATQSEALNPYRTCLPPDVDAAVAERWAELFEVFVARAENIAAVTVWGVTDETSWLNSWPVSGRTNYALLFDRDGQPKSNFGAVLGVAP